jgi:hypothetical protein
MKKYWLIAGLLLAANSNTLRAEEPKTCKLDRFAEIPVTTLPDGRFTVPVALNGVKLDFFGGHRRCRLHDIQ